jgi:uncharacterized membrane protein YqaE (UPF0057 family)
VRYILAVLLPPLAVLMCGKPFQFILNIFLTLLLWLPGTIHAILVVNAWEHKRHLGELAAIAGAARRT